MTNNTQLAIAALSATLCSLVLATGCATRAAAPVIPAAQPELAVSAELEVSHDATHTHCRVRMRVTRAAADIQAFLNGSGAVDAIDADAKRDCLQAVVEDLLQRHLTHDLLTASAPVR